MFTRICIGCGNPFDTPNYRKQRCTKNCGRPIIATNAARAARADAHDIEFIGVDGEGVTLDNGEHHYVLLSVGDQSLSHRGNPLHYDEIFEFLYENYLSNPKAAFVGFFLGYDFTHWLRTITENRANMLLSPSGIASRQPRSAFLHAPFMVTIGQSWDIDLLANKRFKLRPHTEYGATGSPVMYINDAGPFFQTSFLNVIDPAGWPESDYPISQRDYDIILEGKSKRSTAVYDSSMIRYNVTENRALSAVMSHLNKGFVSAGVRLKRNQWFGPGQAANAWLVDHCDHTADQVRDATPSAVLDAAISTYYGGWFEIYAHGHVPGPSWEYDLNSAYPYAITQLPCLLHGDWVPKKLPGALSMEYVTVKAVGEVMGAMPCRDRKGNITRPKKVTGWYWSDEIDAMERAGIARRVSRSRTEIWSYRACGCPPPMRHVRELYDLRIALGQEGKNSPQGKALKLLYNSLYGKYAQSIGSPRFANPIWASRIPAMTRIEIIDCIASHPNGIEDLLMIATDAVFFRSQHTMSLSSTELGMWDETPRQNLTLMMPGIYWDDNTRSRIRDGKSPKLKSRGISAASLAQCIDVIDQQFRDFQPTPGCEWPVATIPLQFAMVTATQAVARHKWELAGAVSTDQVRILSADPSNKRDATRTWWDRGVLRTARPWFEEKTIPYDRRFGMDLADERADDPLTPDGNLTTILHDMFTW